MWIILLGVFEDVPLVQFIRLVFSRMPGEATVDDSGLGCCVPRLSSAIISLYSLIIHRRSRPYSVSYHWMTVV